MAAHIDPASYLRFPKTNVRGALGVAKILLHRVPECPPPAVSKAASLVESAMKDLEAKWLQQDMPVARRDLQRLARNVGAAWKAIRDRLVGFEALPEGHADRTQAILLRDTLFSEGLEFNLLSFVDHHSESEHRLRLLEELGVMEDLARLVGDHFVNMLRAAHEAYGDALGINKATPDTVAVLLTEPLRALADAIIGYALQLIALSRHEPQKRDAVLRALAPIDDLRASLSRRVVAEDDEEEVDAEVDPVVADDDEDDIPVTPLPVLAPAIPLAPVA